MLSLVPKLIQGQTRIDVVHHILAAPLNARESSSLRIHLLDCICAPIIVQQVIDYLSFETQSLVYSAGCVAGHLECMLNLDFCS